MSERLKLKRSLLIIITITSPMKIYNIAGSVGLKLLIKVNHDGPIVIMFSSSAVCDGNLITYNSDLQGVFYFCYSKRGHYL